VRRILELPGYISQDLTRPLPEDFGPFDVVVHAAARSSPWGSRRLFEAANVEATRRLLDHCRSHGRPRFVFISSSSVYYRTAHQFNMTEDDPQAAKPINHYAASKIRAEQLVQQYPGPWAILRPRAVFGPGDTVLFPRILAAARAGRLPRLVSPDGPVLGDVIYIDNLVDMIVKVATRDDISGEFNLTNNQPVPVVDFLLGILSQLSIPTPTREVSTRSAMLFAVLLESVYATLMPWREPPITRFGVHVFAYSKTFNVAKMLKTLGSPKVSLETGVERFVQWVKSQDKGN
jgi:nucleoside-diphosphate-sugar epimerase